jgi:DNA mismatch endonuclease (patch repair protein)
MPDVLTPEQRSRCMSRIRGRDTTPERVVRSVLHQMGYRFRLHRRDLRGKPDIVLTSLNKVVFVHGCFWHMHRCKYGRVVPRTNAAFWRLKREGNVARDRGNTALRREEGWAVLIIWECETRDLNCLENRLSNSLVR